MGDLKQATDILFSLFWHRTNNNNNNNIGYENGYNKKNGTGDIIGADLS